MLRERAFVAEISGFVEYPPLECAWEILLCDPVVSVFVRVFVSDAVPESLLVAAAVPQVVWHLAIPFLFNELECVEESED